MPGLGKDFTQYFRPEAYLNKLNQPIQAYLNKLESAKSNLRCFKSNSEKMWTFIY